MLAVSSARLFFFPLHQVSPVSRSHSYLLTFGVTG